MQALRVSMEEQRQRQEDDQRRALAESDTGAGPSATAAGSLSTAEAFAEPGSEEAMLQRALAMSTETAVKRTRVRKFSFSFFSYFDWNDFMISKFNYYLPSIS